MTNVLKGSTRAPTEAVEVETAWEATTGSEEVEEDLDLAEVVAGGGPDFLELVEVVEDPLVPTLGGDRNNQNRTAEKNCGA